MAIPVKGASQSNWSSVSYWYCPTDTSKVHKGIDIFSPQKTPVLSPVAGLVISQGVSNNGGRFIYLFGGGCRIYYFAHLNTIEVSRFSFLWKKDEMGTVGNSGNALSKPYHLHFSIFSLIPIFKNYDHPAAQGWKKMFYLNPNDYLVKAK
ncbi:peptidoglycan DD-metalloendopeptidase family protein [Mucilaginibacter sp. UYCu711]|uniref:peptidoglycan DD-metalloendopeptidase family protein n=1 Tax=Mucilaginibacter sp. UYCu711 TaxID=3156339 RepID=UPI003D1C9BD5